MSKLKVDELRSADRSVSDSANITLADDGNVSLGGSLSAGTIGSSVSIAAGASFPKLLTTSSSNSAVGEVVFNNSIINADNDTYLFVIDNLHPVVDNVHLLGQAATGNNTSYINANNYWGNSYARLGTASGGNEGGTDNFIRLFTSAGNDGSEGLSGYVWLFGVNSAVSDNCFTVSLVFGKHITTDGYIFKGCCKIPKSATTDVIKSFKFFTSSGNITRHKIRVYGYK